MHATPRMAPVRIGVLLLLCGLAAADPAETVADRLKRDLLESAGSANRSFVKERVSHLYERPDLVLDVCRTAADVAPVIELSRLEPGEGESLAAHLDTLAKNAAGPRGARARLEAHVFRARLERRKGAKSGEPLREAAAGIRRAGAPLRAVELFLQAMHWSGADREPALATLRGIAGDATLPEHAQAAARAAVLVARRTEAKDEIEEMLALLEPHVEKHDAVRRRFNDLVTLGRPLRVKAPYRPIVVTPLPGMRAPVPVSRRWLASLAHEADGSVAGSLWMLEPSGDPRCRLEVRRYRPGSGGRRAARMSARGFARDSLAGEIASFRLDRPKKRGPKRIDHGEGVRKAYRFDVWGRLSSESWRRVRGVVLAGEGEPCLIRMVEREDHGDDWHPELEALVEGIELKP